MPNTHHSMERLQIQMEDSQEEDEEFEKLLQSLPKKEDLILGKPIYQYQHFWNISLYIQAIMSCQRHFQAHHTDIFLVTQPKSGTVWLKALIFAIVKRSCFAPSSSSHPLLTINPHSLVPFLEVQLYVNKQIPDLSRLPSPRLLATHLFYTSLPESCKELDCRIVFLCRNPKDVFVSRLHFENNLRPKSAMPVPIEEAFDIFCDGALAFGSFWDQVLEYWKASLENPKKLLFLKYEDIKQDTTNMLKKLAEFLGYPFSIEEEEKGIVEEIIRLCSFENLSNLDVNKFGEGILPGWEIKNDAYFRKGKVGDWRNYLTQQMAEKIDRITQEKLSATGLRF